MLIFNLSLFTPDEPYHSGGWIFRCCLAIVFLLGMSCAGFGQAPSHDPSTMVRNTDGRYWIFTTGNGVWAMSSSNRDFTDWRPEPTPFTPGTYPEWIDNYVDGFEGFFWAPDVIKIDDTYYLYYSAAGIGAPAAIGLTTATDLNGPWTDQGMVVAGNNAIDPALYMDDNRLWMTWGNWQSGIDIVELSPTTGKRIGDITNLINDQVEGPGLIKNGDYYYLFYQQGLCCNGLTSGYTMMVARSTSITGPYTDDRVFLPNRSGNEHGPGHFGYNYERLTYHYYAVDANGAARLGVTTLDWQDGWPVPGDFAGWSSDGEADVYYLENRGTGMYLYGTELTENSTAVSQSIDTTQLNAQWSFVDVGNGYTQLRNVSTGRVLNGLGRTTNASNIEQTIDSTSINTHWSIAPFDGAYYRFQNRGTGLFIDGFGRRANGDLVAQFANTTHPNAQWALLPVAPSDSGGTTSLAHLADANALPIRVYPNPVTEVLHLTTDSGDRLTALNVYSSTGRLVLRQAAEDIRRLDVGDLTPGVYLLEARAPSGTARLRFVKQ